MLKLPHLRILIDEEPQSGAWNMAVDETLLETAIASDLATLRFYRWREPTASLGYFQREADYFAETRFASLPAVRRLSGGGTLIHDRELNYIREDFPKEPRPAPPLPASVLKAQGLE